jgi:rhodanese-related sulfurtransferase
MIQELPPKACHDLREADPSILLIDVRSPDEFAGGHPQGAFNVPVAFMGGGGMRPNPDFQRVVEVVAPDKTKRLVLSCASGGRSMHACQLLEQAGWRELINLRGGWSGERGGPTGGMTQPGWSASGLPSSRDPGDRGWTTLQARAKRPG